MAPTIDPTIDPTAFSDVFINTALKVTGQRVASARPGSQQHARAVFPNY